MEGQRKGWDRGNRMHHLNVEEQRTKTSTLRKRQKLEAVQGREMQFVSRVIWSVSSAGKC